MTSLQRKSCLLFILCLMCLPFLRSARAAEENPRHSTTNHAPPRLLVSNIQTKTEQGQTVFSFRISQQGAKPQTFRVPIQITSGVGVFHFTRTISSLHTDLSFALPDPPLRLVIDPDRKLDRMLTPSEVPPLWSHFLQAQEITVVPESPVEVKKYAPLINMLAGKVKIVAADEIKNEMLSKTTLLFLGADNTAKRSLFGQSVRPKAGFNLQVHRNPLAPEFLAASCISNSEEQTKSALNPLLKSGNFSSIQFENGNLIKKTTQHAESGQIYTLEQLPKGAPTAAIKIFPRIIDDLATSSVVYVGEIHNSVADHFLEFRIIQALYKKNPDLAIGMEMFPTSSQKALDEYILGDGRMKESEFLKKSRYFETWKYDFRLFRPIFNFARTYKIPVVALNIDAKIVGQIFKTGSTDTLTSEEKHELPVDRNLALPGYADRLRDVFGIHTGEIKAHGTASGFIQAQAVWDESMAKNAAVYLRQHPHGHLVVLAGVEHIRADSGIPPRLARRIHVKQSSVVNITSQDEYSDLSDIANYFFTEQAPPLPPPAQIGILLEEVGGQGASRLKIDGFSPDSKAPEAGLKVNDIVLAIDKNPVYDMQDVRIAMIDVEPGDNVTVKVKRKMDSGQEQEISYRVKTQPFRSNRVHPW